MLEKLVEFAEEKMDDSSSLLQIVVTRCAGSISLHNLSVEQGHHKRVLPGWTGGSTTKMPIFTGLPL